jgi:hypothetical protein
MHPCTPAWLLAIAIVFVRRFIKPQVLGCKQHSTIIHFSVPRKRNAPQTYIQQQQQQHSLLSQAS